MDPPPGKALKAIPCCTTSIPRDVPDAADLVIGARRQGDCQWHPATLWIGIGCERNTSLSLVEKAIAEALATAGLAEEAVAGIASAARKSDEPALLQHLSQTRAWPFRTFAEHALASIDVPNPSEVVRKEMGTASVAEAAALLAAGDTRSSDPAQANQPSGNRGTGCRHGGHCRGCQPHAPQRGELHLVGSGPRGSVPAQRRRQKRPSPVAAPGLATASTSIFWSPCAARIRSDSMASSPGNGTAVPKPCAWPNKGQKLL